MVWVAGYGRRVLDSTYNKNRPFNRKTALNIYDESTPDTCIFCNTLHSCQYVGGWAYYEKALNFVPFHGQASI